MTKVLFLWQPEPPLQAYFRQGLADYPHVELIFPKDRELDSIMPHAHDADIIVGWRPEQAILDEAKKLALYIAPGAGIQHLIKPFKELMARQKVVLVNEHGNSYFVATHGVAMLLTLMSKIISHHNWMAEGKWRTGDDEAKTLPLRDKTVGFFGYGSISRKIHKFLSGFRLEFAALRTDWNKEKDIPPTELKKYQSTGLQEFISILDILFVTLPLTKSTEGIIGMKELKLLGKDGIIVNLGRGPLIVEKDLFDALKDKVIAGAAIDVWYNYRPEEDDRGHKFPYNYPFHKLDNVVLSPHRAASPFEDLERWDDVIENIRRFTAGRDDFLNIVDLDKGY